MSGKIIDFNARKRVRGGLVTDEDLKTYTEEEIFAMLFGKSFSQKGKNGISGKEALEIVNKEFETNEDLKKLLNN